MFKILLIDYSMPDMDGLELVRKLRSLLEEHNLSDKQPIYCCCTAYNTVEHRDIAISSGFDYFMVKPIKKD